MEKWFQAIGPLESCRLQYSMVQIVENAIKQYLISSES
jgi:hypothetical protein